MFFLSLSHKIQLLVFQQEFLCFAVFPISPSPNLRACRSEFGGREPLYSPHYFPIFNPHLTSTLLHLLSGEYTIRYIQIKIAIFHCNTKTLYTPITSQSSTHTSSSSLHLIIIRAEYKIQNFKKKTFFCIRLHYFSFFHYSWGRRKDLGLPASIALAV